MMMVMMIKFSRVIIGQQNLEKGFGFGLPSADR